MMRGLAAIACLVTTLAAYGQEPGAATLSKELGRSDLSVVRLWPTTPGAGERQARFTDRTAPGRDGGTVFGPVADAELVVIPPPAGTRSTGVAVLVCPGGDYGSLESDTIRQAAKWLNAMGASAAWLKYRVPRRTPDDSPHRLPLLDAQRALGLLRSRAAEWRIDPRKIGVLGFSAGGHLAALLANRHDARRYDAIDEHDRVACRPDFCLLLYPAYLTPAANEAPDAVELLQSLDKPLEPALAADRMSATRTPPTFLAVSGADAIAAGAMAYFRALRKADVAAELHVYPPGEDGGCFDRYPLVGWGDEATRFLRDHGVVDAEAASAGAAWLKQAAAAARRRVAGPLADAAGAAKLAPRAPSTPPARPHDALADSELGPGDAQLRKLVGPDAPILRLWPPGKRPVDPFAATPEGKRPEVNATLPSDTSVLRITNVTDPTLLVLRPAKPDGRAVLVVPGGAYARLAIQHEGLDAARWLNEQGITAAVLKYRVPKREATPAPLQDAQRALSLLRSRAAEFGVDPDWIGVLGFSAGGHLAAECCHRYERRSYEPIDELDRASCRPNFALLVYPAYLAEKDGRLAEPFRNPRRDVSPPTFVAFARNDNLIEGAFPYVLAHRTARVPIEFHVYESGGHGKGLRPDGGPFANWPLVARRWLDDLSTVERTGARSFDAAPRAEKTGDGESR